jgi:CubicO group peptidase (beta-lactamase class C family)
VRPVLGLGLVAVALAAGCGTSSSPEARSPDARLDLAAAWVQASPADVGLDAAELEAGAARAAGIPRLRSLLVARHGKLAFERYLRGTDAQTLLDVRSVTKSVVSALVGIAVHDQVLPSLDAPIAPYLEPQYLLDPTDRAVQVRHLMTMTSGFQWDDDRDYNPWIASDDHVQYLLDRPRAQPLGTDFTYDSAAVHVLGVVLQRAAGTPLPEYANQHLFRALGVDGAAWEALDRGTVNGGSGLRLRARDLLKFGQLYLQGGWSAERSIVPQSWVDDTTRPQFAWRATYGAQRGVSYGMLWWVSDADPRAFFAWGYGGQFVYVVPARDLVVVATTDWTGLRETTPLALAEEVLGIIVEHLVPAARP